MKSKKDLLNEVVDINGSKVFVENGEVKTVLSEEIQRTGWMTVEEMYQLIDVAITMKYRMKYYSTNKHGFSRP